MAIEEFTGQLDQERQPQAAQQIGAAQPRVEEFTGELDKDTTKNPLMGGLARILDLAGSGAEAIQRVTAPMRKQLEEAGPESMRSKLLSDEAVRQRQGAFTESARQMSKDIGYEPSTSLSDLGQNPLKVVPFVIERVITSSPDMAGAALAFTPYVMTRANEILNERLKNDGKTYEQATVGDVTAATAGAIGEATLERFATKRILPGGKAVSAPAKGAAETIPAAGLPAALKRVGKEVGVQGSTESLEELSSYGGETIGTKKGFRPGEAGERMLEAGIVGAGLGGGARGAREVYDYAKQPKIEELPPDAKIEPIPEVETAKPVEKTAPEQVTGKEPWEEILGPTPPAETPPVEVAPLEKPPLAPIIPIEKSKKGSKIEGVEEIDINPSELKLSKDVPQFKEDADEAGIVEPLQGKKYDYVGTPPIQVWRRLDGSLEIISGRHRWDLAKRTGAEYIPAQVFDEAKGFNADMAAIMDAELNIRDGKGKVTDYVNYFTEAGNRFGLTKDDYKNRGLLDSEKGRKAYAVSVQGSDELIQALRGRQVKEDTAYRIADAVPNDARLQALGLKLVNEKPLEQAINILHAAKTIEPKAPEGGGEFDLFGFDASGMKLAEDMGKLASDKQRSISEQIKAIEGPGKKSEIAKKYGINVEDPEAIKQKVKDLKVERAAWDNWASDPALVDQIRRELAGDVVEPVATEAKPEAAPIKKPAKKAAKKAVEKQAQPTEKPVESFELAPEEKQTPAERKAAAEREDKDIADREREFFALTPKTSEQGAGDYLQQDMIGAMGLTEAEFKKGIDKKSTEPGEPLILRDVTMSEYDTYNNEANSKVDESINEELSAVPNMKDIDVDEKDVTHTLERQAQAVEDYIQLSSKGRVTAFEFFSKAKEAAANGKIEPDVFNAIERIYRTTPNVLDGLRFEVVVGSKKTGGYREAGHFQPLARMIRLFKDTSGVSDPSTVRHEIAHTMEQMMTPDQKRMIVRAWKDEVLRASKAENTDEGHLFFINVAKYMRNPSFGTLKAMIKSMPNISYYQYVNPSEYWAVNAEKILKSREAGAVKLKSMMNSLQENAKAVFGTSNFSVGNKVFDQILNGDRFTNRMVLSYVQKTKMKNYLGDEAPPATWDLGSSSWVDDLIYNWQDKNVDLFQIQKAIGDVSEQTNGYVKEALSHGRLDTSMKEFDKNYVQPWAESMKKNKISTQQMHEYILARHAPEANAEIAKKNPLAGDSGSGITTEEANNYIRSLSEKRKAQLEESVKFYDKIVRHTQDVLVESGYEQPETIKRWRETYKYYAPLYRKDIDYPKGNVLHGSSKASGAFSKARMGSQKEVDDITKWIVIDHLRALEKIENARVKNSVIALAAKEPKPDFWFAFDPSAVKDRDEMLKKLEAFGCDEKALEGFMKPPNVGVINKKTGLVEYKPDDNIIRSKNVVASRMNGKDWYVVFNANNPRAFRMAQSINNQDVAQLELAMRTHAYISQYIAKINTQINITFGPINFIRDSFGAAFNISTTKLKGKNFEIYKRGWSNIPRLYKIMQEERETGKYSTSKEAEKWHEFKKEGGVTGTKARFIDPQREKNLLEDAMKSLNAGDVRKIVTFTGKWISDWNDVFENAVRLATYEVGLENGLSKQESAYIAKDLINFNRKGAKTKSANALFAFFNAGVQGIERTVRTLKGPTGVKIMAGGVLLGAVQAIALAAIGYRDDEPKEYVKEKNLIIPILGTGKYFTLPMPPIFSMFPGIGRITVEAMIGAAKGRDVKEKMFDMMSMIAGSFNPLGNNFGWQMITPTPYDPIVALIENKNAFGNPIYKEDRATNPQVAYERTRDTTWEGFKLVSQFLTYASGGDKYNKGLIDFTGDELSFLLGYFTGGSGRLVMNTFGAAKDFVTGDETPLYKMPFVGKLIGEVESQAAQKDLFYANVKELAKMENVVKGKIKEGENVYEYYKKHPAAKLVNMANNIENEISQLNKVRHSMIERGATVEQIRKLEQAKAAKMKVLNDAYDKVR